MSNYKGKLRGKPYVLIIFNSLIAGNDAAVRNFELENTLKEVMVERKKVLFIPL